MAEAKMKQMMAGPCAAASVEVAFNGQKTYRAEVCARTNGGARDAGRKATSAEFETDMTNAINGLIDCNSHKCQGEGQTCTEKAPVFRNVGRVGNSEKVTVAQPQPGNCPEGEKTYKYEVRMKGIVKATCECQAS